MGREVTPVHLNDLVDEAATETVTEGFTYTEGPVWISTDNTLLFNDIPADRRMRWREGGTCEVEAQPTNKSNGMTLDLEGRLLICESMTHRIVRREHDGSLAILAERYRGRELNSPNDLVVRSTGDIYFTDPAYGRIPIYGSERPRELDIQGVYRIRATDGSIDLLTDDFTQPNGLCFSPDERYLYVNDTEQAHIRVFGVDNGGALSGGAVLSENIGPGLPFENARQNRLPDGLVDGMKCDEQGHVYVTGPGGLWVISPRGERIGTITLPEEVANMTWGGSDGMSLFCCGRTGIHRVPMRVRAARRP